MSKRDVVKTLTESLNRLSVTNETLVTTLHTAVKTEEALREALLEVESEKDIYFRAFYSIAGRLSTHLGIDKEHLGSWAEQTLAEIRAEL